MMLEFEEPVTGRRVDKTPPPLDLRLARRVVMTRGPEKYRELDLARRRAQIRARRALGLI
jgi:hypothetical protein